jgi:hypothetical protein
MVQAEQVQQGKKPNITGISITFSTAIVQIVFQIFRIAQIFLFVRLDKFELRVNCHKARAVECEIGVLEEPRFRVELC